MKNTTKKLYEIYYYGMLGECVCKMKAPNKTIARQIFNGEMTPDCKIIKIVEVK